MAGKKVKAANVRREAIGILMQALWVLLLLALASYTWKDIPWECSPCNSPTVNYIGPVGAWTAWGIFKLFGLVGFLFPLLLAIWGVLMIMRSGDRVWPRVLWMLAILAGLAIFPALFAVGMTPDKGPGLTFNILPVVFSKMSYGSVFAVLFFILLFIAALTSSISLIEVVVAFITDSKGWGRKKAVLVFGSLIFLLGIPSALSFGALKDFRVFFGTTYFDFMDRLTTTYMLPIGGLLIALCLGWKYGLNNAMHELDADTRLSALRKIWAFSIRYISPFILVTIILYFGVYRMIFQHAG